MTDYLMTEATAVAEKTAAFFVDMDGVLVDWEKGAKKLQPHYDARALNQSRSVLAPRERAIKQDLYDRIIATEGAFWRDLDYMPGAKTLWSYLNGIDGAIVSVLTAPIEEDPECVRAKRDWCVRHLKPYPKAFNAAKDKYRYVNLFKTDLNILIDDRPDNCAAWKGAGGIAIVHKNVDSTIRELDRILGR